MHNFEMAIANNILGSLFDISEIVFQLSHLWTIIIIRDHQILNSHLW